MALVFEGRDAAGKGGVIKRIIENVSPRVARVDRAAGADRARVDAVVLPALRPAPPAAGELVLFDRSWYNRAGVEKVMGFCTPEEHRRFLQQAPTFERMLLDDGIILIKYWFSVSEEVQEDRFKARIDDPLKQWKLSPMDLESRTRWVDYSRAKDEMFVHTDTNESPWHVVESDVKRNARVNCINHLLDEIPYEDVKHKKVKLPKGQDASGYERPSEDLYTRVPDVAADLQ